MNELTHLDLFSGIGGFALAAQWAGFKTIGFCEIDEYCQKILAKNFLADTVHGRESEQPQRDSAGRGSSHQPREGIGISSMRGIVDGSITEGIENDGRNSSGVPRIYPDIFKLDGTRYRGVTLVTGGFPCQPFSVAGKRRGKADDRHLWPENFRIIKESGCAWYLGENVTGIIGMELDQVLSDLEAIGYATRSFVIPACGVDAPHRRNRVWITAYRDNWKQVSFAADCLGGDEDEPGNECSICGGDYAECECPGPTQDGYEYKECDGILWARLVSDAGCELLERRQGESAQIAVEWLPEPGMGRVAHGIPSRVGQT
jgi:DNA (cytosine-5)-methyltransferase 1